MSNARSHHLSQFLTGLRRASSTCSLTIADLERLLDHCLLCRAPADQLGLWFPTSSLWGALDAQRVLSGLAPCAAGKSPTYVYSLCEQCKSIPGCLTMVEDHLLGRPVVGRGAAR